MKKNVKILIIAACAIALVLAADFTLYIASTLSAEDCIEYCKERTRRGASEFVPMGDGRYALDYVYWIAADGDSSKPQEIFAFKKKHVWPFRLERYKFEASSVEDFSAEGSTEAGSLQFFTIDDKGKKESASTLLFFGSLADSAITSYEYTLSVREGSAVYRGNVLNNSSGVWLVKFFGLENVSEATKKVVSDVKFYDAQGNLVCSF